MGKGKIKLRIAGGKVREGKNLLSHLSEEQKNVFIEVINKENIPLIKYTLAEIDKTSSWTVLIGPGFEVEYNILFEKYEFMQNNPDSLSSWLMRDEEIISGKKEIVKIPFYFTKEVEAIKDELYSKLSSFLSNLGFVSQKYLMFEPDQNTTIGEE